MPASSELRVVVVVAGIVESPAFNRFWVTIEVLRITSRAALNGHGNSTKPYRCFGLALKTKLLILRSYTQ
jgi:hypothetical protein